MHFVNKFLKTIKINIPLCSNKGGQGRQPNLPQIFGVGVVNVALLQVFFTKKSKFAISSTLAFCENNFEGQPYVLKFVNIAQFYFQQVSNVKVVELKSPN